MSSQHKLDNMSLDIFGSNKIFFESGGAHPNVQSNTLILESNGWSGIVVEPWTGYNHLYSQSRKNTILENYALVSSDYTEDFINATFSDDFGGSVIEGAHNNPWNPLPYPVTTITKLIKKHDLNEVHLMTVDVEGYEIEVLKGIDFNQVYIHMLIPEHHWGEEFEFLTDFGFERLKVIGNQHVYFNTKSEYYEKAKNYFINF